jgi:hypothetical protein
MLVHQFQNSTALTRASFNPETRQMDVQFVGGRTYSHEQVPVDVFEALVSAASPGRYYATNIKGTY